MLAANESVLGAAGIFVPKVGRTSPHFAGHHNIAFELSNNKHYERANGTLAELLDEIGAAGMPTVCLSSEEFGPLGATPGALEKLAYGLRSIGYEPNIIIYLRAQADYLESLYAEIVKSWSVSFAEVYASVLSTEMFADSHFNYQRLLAPFQSVFGTDRLHVRAYRSAQSSKVLLTEFLTIVCGSRFAVDFDAVQIPERLNSMLTSAEVFTARSRTLGLRDQTAQIRAHHQSAQRHPFEPLTFFEIVRIALVFWPSNDQLRRTYRVRVSGVSWRLFVRELITMLISDTAARTRKVRFRLLDRSSNHVEAERSKHAS